MDTIRVVWGTGRGPTEVSAYDAALADANVHNYNLVHVSSVVPADATVESVEAAPDLGDTGGKLTVVEGTATKAGPTVVSAALGWATGDGPGLFYEAAGGTDTETVETRVRKGLEAGLELRDWDIDETQVQSVSIEAEAGEYAAATVLGVYGSGRSVFD